MDINEVCKSLKAFAEVNDQRWIAEAADALFAEHEKHLAECVQIGQYSDELRQISEGR